ncbi:FAD/NAD(P)-binding domain-containing protein [Xylaria cf. heliscus]|nr:FAD/NAD(P)-binding domain-containing protein [Xylaria cf. heliscus]
MYNVAVCGGFTRHSILCQDSSSRQLINATGFSFGRRNTSGIWDLGSLSPENIIERDVAIIGGGSSGTYTAVRLRDYGRSVVIVEKKSVLGGHAETWTNPSTGYTIDAGVILFAPIKAVTDYFSRFDVELTKLPPIALGHNYVDFKTGQPVDIPPTDPDIFKATLQLYRDQLERFPELQDGFNMSYPVHPDLLLSFREFAEKYKLQDLIFQTFFFNQGYVQLLDISMLYIFTYLNMDQLTIQTPTGRKLILARKLLSTPPPLPANLDGYDLSDQELHLFRKFNANGYYSVILNNTGLNTSLYAASPGEQFNVPVLPGPYTMTLNQGITQVYYGSPFVMSEDDVKAAILERLRRLQNKQGLSTETQPEWLAFFNHAPFNLMVSNDDISQGFYRDLYGLQGQRNTFYHGAAWHTQDSSALWQFADNYILPNIIASL